MPPGVRALHGYRGSWLAKDLVAGVVLTALLVPQGMAYAELAGLPAITAALIAHGRPADTPAAVIQEGTTGSQRQVVATLGTVAADALAAALSHPAICVVGEVVTIAERLTALASALPAGTRG